MVYELLRPSMGIYSHGNTDNFHSHSRGQLLLALTYLTTDIHLVSEYGRHSSPPALFY